jgi:hypothetical protein
VVGVSDRDTYAIQEDRLSAHRCVVLAFAALAAAACTEARPVLEADPVPVVASTSITRERSDAMVALMKRLAPGTRIRRAEVLRVSSDLGDDVVASAFLEPDVERRVFALDAPGEADAALGCLVALARSEGRDTGRVDLHASDVARYGVFTVLSERGQAAWRGELSDVMHTGAEERVGDLDVRVARSPRAVTLNFH